MIILIFPQHWTRRHLLAWALLPCEINFLKVYSYRGQLVEVIGFTTALRHDTGQFERIGRGGGGHAIFRRMIIVVLIVTTPWQPVRDGRDIPQRQKW